MKNFKALNVEESDVFKLLKVKKEDDIDRDKLFILKGVFNAIKDNEISIEEAFGKPSRSKKSKISDLLGRGLRMRLKPLPRKKTRNKLILTRLKYQYLWINLIINTMKFLRKTKYYDGVVHEWNLPSGFSCPFCLRMFS